VSHLLHDLLREAASSTPDHEAVRCSGRSLSYGQLESASNALASTLVAAGVRPGDRVGINLPKCAEMVVAVYGILKAGAAYVPLDPNAPTARIAAVAADCAIVALVTTPSRTRTLIEKLPEADLRLIVLVDGLEGPLNDSAPGPDPSPAAITWDAATADGEATDPKIRLADTDLAYILYTSGSTGTPKGVMLSHRNALAFVEWSAKEIAVRPDDRLSNHAPLHFDLSVFDLFVSARCAATVVLVPEEEAFFGAALARFIEDEDITVWYSVPSALVLLTQALPSAGALPRLRVVIFAGEVFPTKHLRELRRLLPHATLWNLYGPTETNVCTYYRVDHLPDDDRTIPIGRACENSEVFVVREDGAPAGIGEEGELYVRGPTVMRGYWGRPDASADILLSSPLGGGAGEVAYRTGDIVRLRPDGDYEFLGRRDNQIKSRGYRIELGDVEAALNSHPRVLEGVALAVPHRDWGTAIVACVVPDSDAPITEREVRLHVGSRLPRYMVPVRIEILSELPRTSTGKIDRRRLTDEVSLGESWMRDVTRVRPIVST
jgi:amino acid adenylation domain-containing protein